MKFEANIISKYKKKIKKNVEEKESRKKRIKLEKKKKNMDDRISVVIWLFIDASWNDECLNQTSEWIIIKLKMLNNWA